jgi:hypothetical protein
MTNNKIQMTNEITNSKSQINSKYQITNLHVWNLELGAYLEFGACDLEFQLSFVL